jgi:hypothetical protein
VALLVSRQFRKVRPVSRALRPKSQCHLQKLEISARR